MARHSNGGHDASYKSFKPGVKKKLTSLCDFSIHRAAIPTLSARPLTSIMLFTSLKTVVFLFIYFSLFPSSLRNSSRRISVGYALAPEKEKKVILPSLVNHARDRAIDLIPIDSSRPLIDQGPFDCIIHKLSGANWSEQLHRYTSQNPTVPIIDPFDAIERLRDRSSMLQVVSELKIPSVSAAAVGVPKQIVLYSDTLSDPAASNDLKFPVIAKPLVADDSESSHKMSVVFNRDSLIRLKPPVVLQEFVNHGGVIFKVYVVGDRVISVKRKSLPDVSEENLDLSKELLSFSQVSNMAVEDRTGDNSDEYKRLEEMEMPPRRFVEEIARGLRRAMGLNLFNFDMIRDVKVGNRYFIIDINYFPGYAKIPSYESVLTVFFWEIVNN